MLPRGWGCGKLGKGLALPQVNGFSNGEQAA
jgi:hypothetical protein